MTRLVVTELCVSCLLLAVDAPGQKEKIQQTKTERMDFPSGGLLRLNHSVGNLTIEGWDQPDLEITTTKTTRDEYDSATKQKGVEELDRVSVASERHGNEIVLSVLPHQGGLKSAFTSDKVDLTSHIYVPRGAKLAIDHGSGNVYVEGVTGDIHATTHQGEILLRLPEAGQYDIDARSKWGSVTTDFAGQARKPWWQVGRQFAGRPGSTAQKLYLRAGYGDIIILKARKPKEPEAGAK